MLSASKQAVSSAARPSLCRRGTAATIPRFNRASLQQYRYGSDMPVPQSQNAPLWHGHSVKKEGWEGSLYVFYIVGIVLQGAIVMGAPETSIESWARQEAKARLYLQNSKGQTEFEFGTHYQDIVDNEQMDLWNQFAVKATKPGEDDDDDEDEEEPEEEEEDEDEDDE